MIPPSCSPFAGLEWSPRENHPERRHLCLVESRRRVKADGLAKPPRRFAECGMRRALVALPLLLGRRNPCHGRNPTSFDGR
jgi:hypothetical protein